MSPGDVHWDAIFGGEGARWFHCGGIFSALGPSTAELALEAMAAARRHGTIVSFDLNYRPSLWKAAGGTRAAAELNRRLVDAVDVLFGNEEDFSAALGFELDGVDDSLRELDVGAYERLHGHVLDAYPQLALVATSLREAHTATINDWSGVCSTRERLHVGPELERLEIFDRVGGGDSFASGLIYGLLSEFDMDTALAYAVAHGALAMTTPGDTSMATLGEVKRVVAGGSARVER
jgi:2-dehydro-3-deoxygluconokinase